MKVTFYKILIVSVTLTSMLGCTALPRKVVVEKVEPKTDLELRRKLEEWTEQLHSNDPTIRSSAAVSLLGLNLLDAQEPLVKILKDRKENEEVQVSIIKAFGFTRDDRATDSMIELLDSESIPLQTAAAETLGLLKTRTSIRKMSEAMLDPQRSSNIKLLLAKGLGNTNNRDAVEPLIKMLATNDRGLREVAKKSLEKITKQADGNDPAWWKQWWIRNKSKTREQWLEDIVLKQEENTKQFESKCEQLKLEIAQKSIKLLELRPDKSDPKPLIEAIRSESPEVRIFAAKELVKIKDPSVIDVLIDATSDKQEDVRIEVIQTLGEIADERAVKPLVYTLGDESLVVREKSAKALGKLGRPEAEEPLISALNSNTNVTIVCAIIEALGQIGDTRAVEPLIAFLNHKESIIRECATASLGKLHDNRAVESLIAALSDEQERVRWFAADSLGKIGDPICVDLLIKLLSDTSARVRESAVTALGQIGNQPAIESLIKALQDVDKRVAAQAAESLVNIKNMNFEVMDTVANTFYTNKDYKRAEAVLERQITEYSKQPELQEKILQTKIKLAKTLFVLKDCQKSLALYEELVKRFLNDNSIKIELIQCLKETKQHDRALEWYVTWIKESPQNNQLCWQGRLEISNDMVEQGKYDTVKSLIDNLIAEDPTLGGNELKPQFQKLRELCVLELSATKTASQNEESKHLSHPEDKK
ncbi:MAG: HEAT repeat domain-containing protein [Candidatus Brocadiaceae bacterium]|uniref:HEAT repeat domain-containing protein n=1 Tax=Candidatus Wunengus sp. YC61 TaxID=3367698 RepID=UPI00272857BB|nr:HEAT repeat domain-containing protein [Candidatus Brocadiaceae bacterium]